MNKYDRWCRFYIFTYMLLAGIMIVSCQYSYAHYTGNQVMLESVYDGDTFTVMIEVYPNLYKRINIRLYGVDTPEASWRAKCDSELVAGEKATTWLRQKLSGAIIQLDELRYGKYAKRMLAKVYANGEYINEAIIQVGHGRAYFGDKRDSWCE